jgi:hypothetical protein
MREKSKDYYSCRIEGRGRIPGMTVFVLEYSLYILYRVYIVGGEEGMEVDIPSLIGLRVSARLNILVLFY